MKTHDVNSFKPSNARYPRTYPHNIRPGVNPLPHFTSNSHSILFPNSGCVQHSILHRSHLSNPLVPLHRLHHYSRHLPHPHFRAHYHTGPDTRIQRIQSRIYVIPISFFSIRTNPFHQFLPHHPRFLSFFSLFSHPSALSHPIFFSFPLPPPSLPLRPQSKPAKPEITIIEERISSKNPEIQTYSPTALSIPRAPCLRRCSSCCR